ncbi:MAG: motility protein A [Bdellovibrionales bacterium]|jgi:chemotaxis protein MotA|nr:motility protein A [Bdellovibrionales bacterium]MBT3527411.1 motility protein A [Bdellovibrionales bacterium]MBT7669678.1 motility protein A [Bdellovibrionales bacterium]MBT7765664.1 motility protein A [Bdellovibrionales bacterium]
MDIGSVIGLALAFGAIIGAIAVGGDVGIFVDIPSLLVVGLGVIGVTFLRWPIETVTKLASYVMKAIFFTPSDPAATIEEIRKLADTARKESIFALEKVPIDDVFLKKAMTLAADNRPPEVIQSILQLEIDAMEVRHKFGIGIMDGIGESGPAFGMIGTLIGLVQMLQNLSDPSAIGPAMAVALLTTFYGAVIANAFAIPVKAKIEIRSGMEVTKMNIIIAGTLGIVAGENPRLIQEKLNSFLPPAERGGGDDGGGGGEE